MTLLIALLVLAGFILPETVLVFAGIIKGRDYRKWKFKFRMGLVLAVTGALVIGLIRIELRTLPLMLLVLGSAVQGVVWLWHKDASGTRFRKGRVIRLFIGRILLILLAMLPPMLFPEYKIIDTTGSYQIATSYYTYVDTNRPETYSNLGEFRTLNVEFWYPKDISGKNPLILFSHGGFGIKTSNESLFCELASHGYVVCSVDHTYQCFSTTDAKGNTIKMDPGYRREIMTENAGKDPQNSLRCYQKWMEIRTGDLGFVLDQILAEAGDPGSDPVYQMIDRKKIGVMGHSLGGSAALGIGRSRADVEAVIALEAPFMCDITGVTDGGFAFNNDAYPKPILNIYSDSSWNLLSKRIQYAENYKMLMDEAPDTFSVYIKGAGHLGLTDLSLMTPILTSLLDGKLAERNAEETLKIINERALEFFDCYLKGEGEFTTEQIY